MKTNMLVSIIVLLVLVLGCIDKQETEKGSTPTDSKPKDDIRTPSPTVAQKDDVKVQEKLIDMSKEHLSKVLKIPIADIKLDKVESGTWPDSSMGYGKDNESYLPVEVVGYKIFLLYNNTEYEYHGANDRIVSPPNVK